MSNALTLLEHLDYAKVALVLGVLLVLFIAYREQRDPANTFDVVDLVSENGKLSLNKTAQFGAFLISSWGFIYLTVHSSLTEWFYTSYMVAWAGAAVANNWIKTSNPPPPKE